MAAGQKFVMVLSELCATEVSSISELNAIKSKTTENGIVRHQY